MELFLLLVLIWFVYLSQQSILQVVIRWIDLFNCGAWRPGRDHSRWYRREPGVIYMNDIKINICTPEVRFLLDTYRGRVCSHENNNDSETFTYALSNLMIQGLRYHFKRSTHFFLMTVRFTPSFFLDLNVKCLQYLAFACDHISEVMILYSAETFGNRNSLWMYV